MKKNTQNIILTVLLCVFCLCVLAACSSGKEDYFTYSVDNLNLVGKLVHWMHGWIGNYGWTVVVFTVFLKLLMTPLDIWQRVSSRKSTLKMQKMQPIMAEIDKRYGTNSQRANEEKQKLYKKQGFSMFSMCLPMIVSMVIFFVMFGGLRDYSTYSTITSFQSLSGTYFDAYYAEVKKDGNDKVELTYTDASGKVVTTTFEKRIAELIQTDSEGFGTNENFLRDNYTETNVKAYIVAQKLLDNKLGATNSAKYHKAASEAVSQYYEVNHESWLWISNVLQPDTWASVMPTYSDRQNGFGDIVNMSAFGDDNGISHYDAVRDAVINGRGYSGDGRWNGLMLLPIFSVVLSFLSIYLTQRIDRHVRKDEHAAAQSNPQQAASNKVMMILMPLMMAFFGFMYTGAFAIYMVSNYLISLVSTVALAVPVEKIVQRSVAKTEAKQDNHKASYMR